VRGPNVMMGYYERPADTAAALQDGLLHTGDLARIDEHGDIWITGRASLVVSMPNGKQVNLETMEAELAQATEIEQLRLTVEQDPEWRLIANVFASADILAAGTVADADGLQRTVREVVRRQSLPLPSWLRVDEIRLVDEPLSVTRLGKLRRVELPDRPFDFAHWSTEARAAAEADE